MASPRLIRVGHSPDPDDAFMFYALASGRIDTGPYRFEHLLEDIESLNHRARRAELELTAISVHAYAYLADRYVLCSCGASMGEGYGPLVVAPAPLAAEQLAQVTIAVPGKWTSAFLALGLFLRRRFSYVVVPFDRIVQALQQGQWNGEAVGAGLLIHEGQLTYGQSGLHAVVDLGQWWTRRTGLPLPLGGNAVRRDLGPQVIRDLNRLLYQSICYALDHRREALEYAGRFGRGLQEDQTDRFVGMYVNRWTLDWGSRGREAVRRFLEEGHRQGLLPQCPPVEFVPSPPEHSDG